MDELPKKRMVVPAKLEQLSSAEKLVYNALVVEKALKLYDSQTHSVAEITVATGVTKATLLHLSLVMMK